MLGLIQPQKLDHEVRIAKLDKETTHSSTNAKQSNNNSSFPHWQHLKGAIRGSESLDTKHKIEYNKRDHTSSMTISITPSFENQKSLQTSGAFLRNEYSIIIQSYGLQIEMRD